MRQRIPRGYRAERLTLLCPLKLRQECHDGRFVEVGSTKGFGSVTRLLAKYLLLLDNVVIECTVEQLSESEAGERPRMMSSQILYF